MQNEDQSGNEAVLTITYEFNAPRELVFDAFANADAMSEWWGPSGYKLIVISLDFRPGGIFHYKMESPARVLWGRFVYGQIKKPELIEFVLSFSDERAGITRAPFFNPWPLEIFNKLTLAEEEGRTIAVLKSYPINATPDEIASYVQNKSSFRQGLTINFDELQTFLFKHEPD